jgi:hypothetical protein
LVAVAAAIAVLVGAGAGACGPSGSAPREQADGAGGSNVEAPGTPRPTRQRPSSERHSDLDVPDGMRPRAIDFVDTSTGYVLFAGCTGGCRGLLFVSFDGGFSWVERALPADRFDDVDQLVMHVVDARTVVVRMGPAVWYRSTDTGRKFARGAGDAPTAADVLRGVGVGCVTGNSAPVNPTGNAVDCPRAVFVDGVPTPAQPPLPAVLRGATRAPGGPIWAVSADLTTVHTARSDDDGRTWRQVGGPLAVPGTNVVQVTASVDGVDVWLLAGVGTGPNAAYFMYPEGWREINDEVRVAPDTGSAAAAGAGVLAVPGERFGFVFLDGQWSQAARPTGAHSARALPDGTLFVTAGPGDAWLGAGSGAARLWNRVTVDAI